MKILVVCHGNMYRSVAAQAFLRRLRPNWTIDSAGLKISAKRAGAKMRRELKARGLDVESHKPAHIENYSQTEYDLVLCMGPKQQLNIRENWFPHARLLSEFAPMRWTSKSIPDPAFLKAGNPKFREVVNLIEQCCKNLVERMQ